MQNNRSRVVIYVAVGVALFGIWDPFGWFESSGMTPMRVNPEIRTEMVEVIQQAPNATSFVVSALEEDADLVLIGESSFLKQQLVFAAELIPELAEAGVNHFAFQYANAADQALVDELLNGSSFDDVLAKRILFNHLVILGYQEHVNVLRSAWQVNRSRGEEEQPFRVVAVGSPPDFTHIEQEDDTEDPEVLRKVFADGIPDEQMAEIIRREILEPGHKAVAYVQQQHAFSGFEQPLYAQNMEESGFPNQKRMGAILREEYGSRVITALLHGPVRVTRSRTGYGYPLGGVLDGIISELPEGEQSTGFFVERTPFADAPLTGTSWAEGIEEEVVFSELTDTYLTLVPISEYEPVTAIPDFITQSNLAEALNEFPGPSPGEVSAAELNEYISGYAAQWNRILEEFE